MKAAGDCLAVFYISSFYRIFSKKGMKIFMSTEVIALYISSAGVLVTGVFSFFIASANSKSATAATEATKAALESARISQTMMDMQTEQRIQIRSQLIREVLKSALIVQNGIEIFTKTGKDYTFLISAFPNNLNISNVEIGIYFNKFEAEAINIANMHLELYRKRYIKDGVPSYTIDQVFLEGNKQLHLKMTELIDLLEKAE